MRYADAMARAWPGQATIDREALIACSDERARHGALPHLRRGVPPLRAGVPADALRAGGVKFVLYLRYGWRDTMCVPMRRQMMWGRRDAEILRARGGRAQPHDPQALYLRSYLAHPHALTHVEISSGGCVAEHRELLTVSHIQAPIYSACGSVERNNLPWRTRTRRWRENNK